MGVPPGPPVAMMEWLHGANPSSHRERKLLDLLPPEAQPTFETLTDMANYEVVRSITFYLRVGGQEERVRFAEPLGVFPSDELLAKVMLVV